MIGETISHYEILEKLGEGGMGVVYRAKDLKLSRDVAIKFLPPHLSTNADAAKRFEQEAKAASALNHPNIGTIHEIDETDDGTTFIVMAYYEGESLRAMIDHGKIEVDTVLDIVSQIASGLTRAHSKGIIHRDIKPSNILITTDGHAEIIDFGLAKLAGSTRLTREGITVGTAAYMSPEQAKGEELDHRSDIFSLGVILYEVLSGYRPFKGEHEAALLYEIVHEQPESVSACGRELPEGLQDVVDRAMAKSSEERYQSADELRQDLDEFRKDSMGGSAAQNWRTTSDRKRAMRRRLSAAIIVAAAVAAVFIIYRLRAPAELCLSISQWEANPSGDIESVEIINCGNDEDLEINISSNATWITANPNNGTTPIHVAITAENNTSGFPRSGKIQVTSDPVTQMPKEMSVTQLSSINPNVVIRNAFSDGSGVALRVELVIYQIGYGKSVTIPISTTTTALDIWECPLGMECRWDTIYNIRVGERWKVISDPWGPTNNLIIVPD